MITKKGFVRAIILIVAVNVLFIVGVLLFVQNRLTANASPAESVSDDAVPLISDEAAEEPEYDYPDIIEEMASEVSESDLDALRSQNSSERSYDEIYRVLLPGNYVLEDGLVFNFGANGVYSGYFNDENLNVTNYTYDIGIDMEGNNIVVISARDGSSSITYVLNMEEDENGNGFCSIYNTELDKKYELKI